MIDDQDTNDNKQLISVHKQSKPKKAINKNGLKVLIVIAIIGVITAISTLRNVSKTTVSGDEQITTNPDVSSESPIDMWQFDKPFSSQFKFNKRNKSDYIAVLYIKGVIESKNKTYNQSWLLSTIQDLTEDPKNKAIMLYINSPGGGVYEADAVYLALEDYKTKTSKPVFAYLGPLAASGGYYIACAATTIFANRNTLTGSIGVISGSSIDATRLMDKLGITMTTITAGRNKNMGNYNEPFNDEQKAIMQSIADEAYDQFTSIVASSRKMPLKQVHVLADGRIYSALQAKNNGLIDQVCSWEDALAELKKEENVGNCTVEPFKVEEKTSFYEYVKGAVSSIATISATINKGKALDLLIRNLHNNQPVLQYLYQQ